MRLINITELAQCGLMGVYFTFLDDNPIASLFVVTGNPIRLFLGPFDLPPHPFIFFLFF